MIPQECLWLTVGFNTGCRILQLTVSNGDICERLSLIGKADRQDVSVRHYWHRQHSLVRPPLIYSPCAVLCHVVVLLVLHLTVCCFVRRALVPRYVRLIATHAEISATPSESIRRSVHLSTVSYVFSLDARETAWSIQLLFIIII